MPDYRIRILTSADTAGLQQTQQATDKLTRATKDLNAEMGKATQAYRDGQQPALANAAANQKAGDAMDGAGRKSSRLVEGLKKAQSSIPGLNFALGSLTNVWTLAAVAVVALKSKYDEWTETIKKSETRLKIFQDLNKEITRFSENLQQAKLDAEAFGREMDAIRGQGETPEEEGARSSAQVSRKFGSTRIKMQGEKQLELDKIERREAAGELTGAAADQARLQVNRRFEKRGTELDLAEKAEQAFIARRVAGAEGGRAAQLAQRMPAAQEALTAAKNRRDDAERSLKAALEFGGFDENLKPVEGGKAAELERDIKKGRNAPGVWEKPLAPDVFQAREKMRGELSSLKAGAIFAREQLFNEDRNLAAEQDAFKRLSGDATGAAGRARGLGRTASEATLDLQSAVGVAGAMEALSALSAAEKAKTSDLKEAARMGAEVARDLKENLQSMGKLHQESRGLRDQTADLQSRNRANVQHD